MSTTVLRGIGWNHLRGMTPVIAAAERFRCLHPDCIVQWDTRQLSDFIAEGQRI